MAMSRWDRIIEWFFTRPSEYLPAPFEIFCLVVLIRVLLIFA